MALLTATCFTTAGTVHFQTPMLPEFAREFGASAAAVGWVATASFGGFLAGTLTLAPLGDRFDKRRLIIGQLGCLIAAMLAMGAAPSLPVLVGAAFFVGAFVSISQHILPFIAEFSAPAERGRAIGTVMSGLFLGILFGRLGGGFITAYLGWRWTYAISAAMMLALAPALIARLPSAPPRTRLPYAALMRSLFGLVRSRADLRRASGRRSRRCSPSFTAWGRRSRGSSGFRAQRGSWSRAPPAAGWIGWACARSSRPESAS
jgi:predicted MFS family arabinose efflux permease